MEYFGKYQLNAKQIEFCFVAAKTFLGKKNKKKNIFLDSGELKIIQIEILTWMRRKVALYEEATFKNREDL